MTTISIALCTYNGEQYLKEQLDSFLKQRRLPDELIVCDDRSTDGTIQIVESFAGRASFPVRVFVNEENLGSTRNFEKAIKVCTGDLIFLSDQDDVWLPVKLERMEHEFASDRVGLVFSDADLVDENLRPIGRRLSGLTMNAVTRRHIADGNVFESLLNQNIVTGATAAFRSSLRNEVLPIPADIPNLVHDAWIAISVARVAGVVFIDEALIEYRQHESQQIGLRLPGAEDRPATFAATIAYLHGELERLEAMKKVFPDQRALIDRLVHEKREYIEHCEVRRDLPDSRLRRVGHVATEMFSGRYGRFSAGLRSAAKDLLGK